MTAEERELLQTVLSNVYEQFVDVISEGRNLDREDILPYADGRIFSGDQARDYGFVDRLGDLNDAILLAAGMAGIPGRPTIVKKERRRVSLLDLFQQRLDLVPGLGERGPRLEYRLR